MSLDHGMTKSNKAFKLEGKLEKLSESNTWRELQEQKMRALSASKSVCDHQQFKTYSTNKLRSRQTGDKSMT